MRIFLKWSTGLLVHGVIDGFEVWPIWKNVKYEKAVVINLSFFEIVIILDFFFQDEFDRKEVFSFVDGVDVNVSVGGVLKAGEDDEGFGVGEFDVDVVRVQAVDCDVPFVVVIEGLTEAFDDLEALGERKVV